MILNLGTIQFNANIEGGGGTPSWGTELGQGEGYKFSFEDMDDFIPIKNFSDPWTDKSEEMLYSSLLPVVLSFSILVNMTLFIIIAISYTLLKLR